MWKTHSYKCKIWGVGWGCTLLLNQRRPSGRQMCLFCFWMLDQIKAASWWIIPAEWRWFVGIVMRQSGCFTKWNRNKPPKSTWCVLCAGNCVAKSNEQARWGQTWGHSCARLRWNLPGARNESLFSLQNLLTSARFFFFKGFLVKRFRGARHSPIFPSSTNSKLMGYWQLK